jgi:hypothetical protein|tara:strand:+ start:224 stop:613 length:390 start_codon:yes stop_codon:yes gene_type:complete
MANLSLFPKSLEAPDRKDPIRDLWRNVLIVALEDALGKGFKKHGLAYGVYADSHREYFTVPNWDFKIVCDYAGLDHEYVRMKARQFFKKKLKEREENAQRNLPRVQRKWFYNSSLQPDKRRNPRSMSNL